MKLIINFRTYNTDTAKIIAKYSNGRSRSDFKYIDETLYRKKNGEFFLVGQGGALTAYSEPYGNGRCSGSTLFPYTEKEAQIWLMEHGKTDAYIECFGEPAE